MDSYEKFDDAVERYLRGQMSSEEEIAFKKELDNSEDLKERAATIAMVIKTIQEEGQQRDRKIISELQNMTEDEVREIVNTIQEEGQQRDKEIVAELLSMSVEEVRKKAEDDDILYRKWANIIAPFIEIIQMTKIYKPQLDDRELQINLYSQLDDRELQIDNYYSQLSSQVPNIKFFAELLNVSEDEVLKIVREGGKKTEEAVAYKRNNWIAIAAVAACFIGAILLIPSSWKSKTISLGERSYATYTFYESGQSRGEDISTEVGALKQLYENVENGDNLVETISQLESIYESSKEVNSTYHDYDDDIAWNLSIAYLKKGDRKRAKNYLEEIVKRNVGLPVAKVAQDLIDKIENL